MTRGASQSAETRTACPCRSSRQTENPARGMGGDTAQPWGKRLCLSHQGFKTSKHRAQQHRAPLSAGCAVPREQQRAGPHPAPRAPGPTHEVGGVHDPVLHGVGAVQGELQHLLLFFATFGCGLLLQRGEREREGPRRAAGQRGAAPRSGLQGRDGTGPGSAPGERKGPRIGPGRGKGPAWPALGGPGPEEAQGRAHPRAGPRAAAAEAGGARGAARRGPGRALTTGAMAAAGNGQKGSAGRARAPEQPRAATAHAPTPRPRCRRAA